MQPPESDQWLNQVQPQAAVFQVANSPTIHTQAARRTVWDRDIWTAGWNEGGLDLLPLSEGSWV